MGIKIANNPIKIYALGGLGEVGKNTYCIEDDDNLILIDAGVMFPEESVLGINYVIPDYTHLKNNRYKIRALFITHGHEDHIGGIPFLLRLVNIPFIYASPLACAMIRRKLEEKRLTQATKLIQINNLSQVKTKYLNIGFFKTNHSSPESLGIVVNTPNGRIVSTGDFKFDLTPIGPMADVQKIAKLGSEGVTLLLSDSTNAMNSGISTSESKVDDALEDLFNKHDSRIIIATFASNIYRLKHIVDTCKRHGRKS